MNMALTRDFSTVAFALHFLTRCERKAHRAITPRTTHTINGIMEAVNIKLSLLLITGEPAFHSDFSIPRRFFQ